MARYGLLLAFVALSCTDGSPRPEACAPGDSMQRLCGNCGTKTRSCDDGAWGEWSTCEGQGDCAAGAVERVACGSEVGACQLGARVRTCSPTCAWDVWSACQDEVEPSAEVCGNGVDENCNGQPDEGCACSPAALGAGGSFALPGRISKLVAHPERCFVYALDQGSPSGVVVIDANRKQELARIGLPYRADDFDLSPDGTTLVVSHDADRAISTIDPLSFERTGTTRVESDPYAVEVSDAGTAYYSELDQWCAIRAVTLATGAETVVSAWSNYEPDLELSRDGRFLFAGESNTSSATLTKYDVSEGGWGSAVDASIWDDLVLTATVYLSPGGQHVYYAGRQFDAGHLANVRGSTNELVFAEDVAGTFAVGSRSVHDAALLKPVASFPSAITAAALTAGDTELWTYGDGIVSYRNVGDLVDPATLGRRELAPEPLSSYGLDVLVADPIRRRLYGLDVARELVVAIDADTLAPLGAILVASQPSDLDVAPGGEALYVGHVGALSIARIDLASFTFDGFLWTPRLNADIEVLAQGRVATTGGAHASLVTLLDSATGQVLDESPRGFNEGALSATGDGTDLFVGEFGTSAGDVVRYDVSSGRFVQRTWSSDEGYGFRDPARTVVALPDGSGVYYGGYLLDGNDLTVRRYPQADRIRAVTPDGGLAFSADTVYRVADGAVVGTLPVTSPVQATSPDGTTLYLAGGGSITKVDLTGSERLLRR